MLRARRAGAWRDLSYEEVAEQVEAVSIGLIELGVAPGDRVAILSENRPEWAIGDFACLCARAADVPIYPTLPPRQIAYILRDAGAVAVLVGDATQLAKVRDIRAELPDLRHVIVFDREIAGAEALSLDAVAERGRAARARHPGWRDDALAARLDDLATIIYTSGTTGDPKGVMLSHGNITFDVVAGLAVLPLRDSDECLSLLPLSHIFERMAGHYCMIQSGAVISYATSLAAVPAELLERRPTVVCAVPRFYEKVHARVLESATASPLKRRIFDWARSAGERWTGYVLARRPLPRGLVLRHAIADRLVFAKLRARTGGRVRFFVAGGAPLAPDIAHFFFMAGLPVLEGYGLTETSPVIAVNSPGQLKIGTVGRPLAGVEVRIAADGEILTRGPHVMLGYFQRPEATAEALDADGWFHTGDIGVIDGEGYLVITDRKKDIIVTAGGKNIAPQPIENRAKSSRWVTNAVMLGDRRRFPLLIVVPNRETVRAWAEARGLPSGDLPALLNRPETVEAIEREVMETLKDLAHFELPKRLMILPEDFSIESGELTPTLKVKRRVVERNHQQRIEELYRTSRPGE